MKLSKDALDALREGGAEAMAYELTPERKKKLTNVCDQIIDLLRKETEGPIEAIIALRFVQETLEEMSGVEMKGHFVVNKDEKRH